VHLIRERTRAEVALRVALWRGVTQEQSGVPGQRPPRHAAGPWIGQGPSHLAASSETFSSLVGIRSEVHQSPRKAQRVCIRRPRVDRAHSWAVCRSRSNSSPLNEGESNAPGNRGVLSVTPFPNVPSMQILDLRDPHVQLTLTKGFGGAATPAALSARIISITAGMRWVMRIV